jgi:hypothetical protein
MRKNLLIITVVLAMAGSAQAQYSLDSAKAKLYKINKVFDSATYLGFDVHIAYNSDTLYGKFVHEEMDGNYVLNEKSIYYKMGAAEFAQNDSFSYSIDHDDKLIIMVRQQNTSNGSLFPLKHFLDSTLNQFDTAYNIILEDTDDFSRLSFTAKFDTLPYRYFAIYYDSSSYYPNKFEMEFYDGGDESDTVFLVNDSIHASQFTTPKIKRRIAISFSNYNTPNSLEVFDNNRYVWFNRVYRSYEPSDRFKGYRLIANEVEADDVGKYIERTPPRTTSGPL